MCQTALTDDGIDIKDSGMTIYGLRSDYCAHLTVVAETEDSILFADGTFNELGEWTEDIDDIDAKELSKRMHDLAADIVPDQDWSGADPLVVARGDEQ
ncbi:hypothetical protein [Natronobeatus ordinarius]|uniref:hypothetical protein n=1 Tax=Natronobeatus ordinarius TaxID=2963433 RepID=UPI0020CF54C7|nr:hypothetical protein [Natronobeatus ordinarius]